MVILDAMENQELITDTLKWILEDKNEKYSYFKLKDMNILPCRCCGSCNYISPGKCVFQDDIDEILRGYAQSSVVVMLTPIRFGGYSSQLKKAVDKFMVLGAPLYIVKDGHLLHPMRYGSKLLLVIGMTEGNLKGQEESFETLVANNALNMLSTHKTLIFKSSDDKTTIAQEIERALREVQ